MATTHDASCQCVDCRSRRRAQQLVADAVGPRPTSQEAQHYVYVSTRKVSTLAIICFALLGVLLVISIISTIAEINLLQEVADGGFLSKTEADSNDKRQMLIGWLYLGGFVFAAVVFLVWINRVSKNLSPLGVENQQHSPGWAVGCWFVPIVWLYRPYQVMKELWRGSYSEIGPGGLETWSDSPVPRLLGFWWAAWLVSSWVDWIATRILFSGDLTASQLITSDWFAVIAGAFSLVALVLVVILIRGLGWCRGGEIGKRASLPS